jgi:hypothetical protein
MNKLNYFFLSALLFIGFTLRAQHNIILNLKVGNTYTHNQSLTSITNQLISGMPQDTEMLVNTTTNFTVTGMKGENFLIDVVPLKMSTTQKSPMGNVEMNSEGEQSNPMNRIMKNLTGKTIKMELSPYGEIITFNSGDYLDSMTDGIELPESALEQIKSEMKEEYNDAALKDSYIGLFNFYRKNKVEIGDSWTQDVVMDVIMPIEAKSNFTLSEVTDNEFTIMGKTDLNTDGEKDTKLMGMDVKSNFKGQANSTIVLDRNTGWIKNMTMVQNLDGTMVIAASDKMPQEMTIKMKVENLSEIK